MNTPHAFRSRVLAQEWLCGTFLNLGSPITVEIAGLAGFDWLLIDHEHGAGGEDTLIAQLQAAAATPAFPIVRIAANETPRFKRALDLGALGVMVPFVSTVAETRAAVAAMRYPPLGVRGVAKFQRGAAFGGEFEDYYVHAHERLVTIMQVENAETLTNLNDIAAVDGADVLFVGPSDLSYNLGIRDQLDHPRFVEALQRVRDAAKNHGKAAGILARDPAEIAKYRDLGYTFVALGSDGAATRSGLLQFVAALRAK